jgi:hypothetical protein
MASSAIPLLRLAARGIPFMFSTGYGDDGQPTEWKAYPVIGKPFDERLLQEALAGLFKGGYPIEVCGPSQQP